MSTVLGWAAVALVLGVGLVVVLAAVAQVLWGRR